MRIFGIDLFSSGSTNLGPALMPADRISRKLRELRVGDKAWCVPWAIDVDRDRRCLLDTAHTAGKERHGTSCVLVSRQRGGWVVNIYHVGDDYRWDVSEYARGEVVLALVEDRPDDWRPPS